MMSLNAEGKKVNLLKMAAPFWSFLLGYVDGFSLGFRAIGYSDRSIIVIFKYGQNDEA